MRQISREYRFFGQLSLWPTLVQVPRQRFPFGFSPAFCPPGNPLKDNASFCEHIEWAVNSIGGYYLSWVRQKKASQSRQHRLCFYLHVLSPPWMLTFSRLTFIIMIMINAWFTNILSVYYSFWNTLQFFNNSRLFFTGISSDTRIPNQFIWLAEMNQRESINRL